MNSLLRFLYVFRHRLVGVLLGLVCIAAPAHAEHPVHPKPLLVGFAQDHLADDWRLAQLRELEQALEVETLDQQTFLQQEGCDIGQGYFYSRPVPAADFLELLRHQRLPVQVNS